MICATCNLHYPDHLNYCRRCGNPLIDSTGEPVIEALCCTRCGARFVLGENFCQQCGCRLGQRSQETVVGGCYGCGTAWRSGWLYCRKCGLDRDQALMGPVSASAGGVSPVPLPGELDEDPVEKVPCPACGVTIKPYSRFCEACGASISPYSRPISTSLNANEPDVAEGENEQGEDRPEESPVDDGIASPFAGAEGPVEPSASPDGMTTMEATPRPATERPADSPRPGFVIPVGGEAVSRGKKSQKQKRPSREEKKPTGNAAWQAFGIVSVLVIILGLAGSWWMMQRQAGVPMETNGPVLDSSSRAARVSPPVPAAAPAPEGMLLIQGGVLRMGREDGDKYERPVREIRVESFFMDRHEVTNESYLRYLKATGAPPPAHWKNGAYPEGQSRFPVVNVSWDAAKSFAEWAGKRLPSEAEWEYAARGSDGRLYPWGNGWVDESGHLRANAAQTNGGKIMRVGAFPSGGSPFGVSDMSGNVWEWTSDKLLSYADGVTQLAPGRVIRGGAFDVGREQSTTTYRGVLPAEKGYDKTGFRCVRDLR